MKNQNSAQLTKFIALVPKNLRKYLKQGVFMIPASDLIQDYENRKAQYLSQISESKQPSANSMHKYTSTMPLNPQQIQRINQICAKPLSQYCALYLKQYKMKNTEPQYHGGFAITYNEGHKGLALHKDDSQYTINICLKNQAEGNEVVFNSSMSVSMIEDYVCVHPGAVPHHTEDLKQGERVNVVLWFK